MSLDLSAAVEAAATDLFRVASAAGGGIADRETYHRDALTVLTAAAPLIEAQVRAQVAAEIRARIVAEPLLMYVTDWRDGMETAADIAGGAS